MTARLRDALAREVGRAEPPVLDLDAVLRLGERGLRRRRWALCAGGAAAMAAVVAISLAVSALAPGQRSEGPSGDPASPTSSEPTTAVTDSSRALVYSDGELGGSVGIHLGADVVATVHGFAHLDVTDAGVVWTDSHQGVWFSDGGRPARIGDDYCGPSGNFSTGTVQAAPTGSLVAWLDCSNPDEPEVVVVDTSDRIEVLRRSIPSCGPTPPDPEVRCGLVAIVGGHVYVARTIERLAVGGEFRDDELLQVDVTTGHVVPSTSSALDQDVRSEPRGLVLGDSWREGNAVAGSLVRYRGTLAPITFQALGGELAPLVPVPPEGRDTRKSAFDTATGKRLDLRLPSGYRADSNTLFFVTQWLDDDTLVLDAGGDLLTCGLADGRCTVAVPAPRGGEHRVAPTLPLPG